MQENQEVFRIRTVESPETQETAPLHVKDVISDELEGFEKKATDETTNEENELDIWEGLNRRKYGADYFDIRGVEHTFPLKAEFGFIDKFVKAEMTEKGLKMNVDNYRDFLADIENEIGTSKLEPYKRINRLFNYFRTLQRYNEIKAKKEAFKSLM